MSLFWGEMGGIEKRLQLLRRHGLQRNACRIGALWEAIVGIGGGHIYVVLIGKRDAIVEDDGGLKRRYRVGKGRRIAAGGEQIRRNRPGKGGGAVRFGTE